MKWIMWAYKYENYYAHFGCIEYVKMHHLSNPIVQVEITEDINGNYYGWVEGENLRGALLWVQESLMEMCFAYGSKVEEERGKGRKARFTVKEI